jgi:acetyltransferase-like isoleucine patch superfamily enzyme
VVTTVVTVRAYLRGKFRRWLLDARRNTSVHPTVEVGSGVEFGIDGPINVAPGCRLRKDVLVAPSGGHVNIGRGSLVNAFGVLLGHGGIDVGEDVLIGPHTTIVAGDHTYENRTVRIDDQPVTGEGIRLEDDVWIGADVTVLDGVTIEKGSVVAAGSVVVDSVPEYTVVAGVPAEPVGTR